MWKSYFVGRLPAKLGAVHNQSVCRGLGGAANSVNGVLFVRRKFSKGRVVVMQTRFIIIIIIH